SAGIRERESRRSGAGRRVVKSKWLRVAGRVGVLLVVASPYAGAADDEGATARPQSVVAPAPGVQAVPLQAQRVQRPENAPMQAAARAGSRLTAAGDFGTIPLSDRDGRTWKQAASVPTRTTLTALHLVDDRHGWAVGHGGIILSTEDAGETWQIRHREAADDSVLFSVHFSDASNGLAVGAFGLALRT